MHAPCQYFTRTYFNAHFFHTPGPNTHRGLHLFDSPTKQQACTLCVNTEPFRTANTGRGSKLKMIPALQKVEEGREKILGKHGAGTKERLGQQPVLQSDTLVMSNKHFLKRQIEVIEKTLLAAIEVSEVRKHSVVVAISH